MRARGDGGVLLRIGGVPCNGGLEAVVHAAEAKLRAEADAAPDLVFGGDEVGEALANAGKADKGGDIGGCDVAEDVAQYLIGEGRDGAGGWECAFYLGGGAEYGQVREAGD